MKKKRTFTVMAIIIAVLVLGIGYAAIADIPLNITGSANIVADSDFSVEFDTTHTVLVDPSSGTVTLNNASHPIVSGTYSVKDDATMTVYLD